jgi:hypothetical protein
LSLLSKYEKDVKGTAKAYADRLIQPSRPLTRFDRVNPILSLLAALGRGLPRICKFDFGQRAQPHLALASADGVTKKPALVELSRGRPCHLQIEATSVSMHAHFSVCDLER